jgi:hypothetical protein
MKLFGKNKNMQRELHPFLKMQLIQLNNKLKLFAAWLQQKTNRYSSKKIKILLLVFCFVFLIESLLVIYQGFKKEHSNFYFITPIRNMPLLQEKYHQPLMSTKEFNRIHDIKIYLDSLQTTAKGKLKFDSLLSTRPYLTGTINYLENIYYEQQTNRK